MGAPAYETDGVVSEYLLFHYGRPEEILPYPFGPREALDFAVRCVSECADAGGPASAERALDLGCAVGRSSFELARRFPEVVGIDSSSKFIEAARTLRRDGVLDYERRDEGELTTPLRAFLPEGIELSRVSFAEGDAEDLPGDTGAFDFVLMANLIDRLGDPQRCLRQLPGLVRTGGRLVITSPYTWLPEFTPKEKWLGGKVVGGRAVSTKAALEQALETGFDLIETRDLPFLIREHARKFQWSVAQATIWSRR